MNAFAASAMPAHASHAGPGRAAFFDIFDTILVRRLGTPECVFLLLGERLKANGLVAGAGPFAQARRRAEHEAQSSADPSTDRQFTLDDIYDRLAAALAWTGTNRDTAKSAELELENELLVPVPAGATALAAARARGDRIAFVSDTYLPTGFLRNLLDSRGLSAPGDLIIASCEERIGKASGGLFAVAMERVGLPAGSVCHRGNSLPLDVRPARARGLAVEHFDSGNPTRYERALCDGPNATPLSCALAGASRLARLQSQYDDAHAAGIRRVAAGVIAPALIGFAHWLLRETGSLGLDRMFFLARDGQVLQRVTDRLAARMGTPMHTSYVHASRKAWNLAALTEIDASKMRWVFEDTPFLSASVLLGRLGLRSDDLRQELERIGIPRKRWAANLDVHERLSLRELILTDASVRELVLSRAGAQRGLVLDALHRQGLMDQERLVVVDLGWHGSMQSALRRMLGEAGPGIHGRYFGVYSHAAPQHPSDTMAGWFVDATRGQTDQARRLTQLGFVMETFCAADHGTTVGYERAPDGSVLPVLDSGYRPLAAEWGLSTLRDTLDAVVDSLPLDIKGIDPTADTREPVRAALEQFWFDPSPDDARAWGAMPVDDRLGHLGGAQRLAPPFGVADVLAAAAGAFERPGRSEAWFRGSLAQSPRLTRRAMSAACRLGRLWTSRPRRAEDTTA